MAELIIKVTRDKPDKSGPRTLTEMINFNEISYTVIDFVVESLCSSIRLRDNDSVLILFRRFSDFLYESILQFEYDWSEYKVLMELQEKDPELPIEDCHKLEEQFFNQCVRKIARSLLTLIYISRGLYYNPEGEGSGWIYPHRYIPKTNGEMPACASGLIDRLYPLLYSKNGNVCPYHGVLIHSVPLELPEPDETEARFGMTLEQLRPVVGEYYISSRAAGTRPPDEVLQIIESKLSRLVKDWQVRMGLIKFEFGSFYKRSESDIFREEVIMALEIGYSHILGLYTIFNITINCSDGIVFTHSSEPIRLSDLGVDTFGKLNLFLRDILQPK